MEDDMKEGVKTEKQIIKDKFESLLQYIREGLEEEDAIILADFTSKEYHEMLKNYPKTKVKVKKAQISFKHGLLKQVNSVARSGEPKLCVWLLEKKFGDEFNQKATDPNPANADDLLVSAIKDIQKDKRTTEFAGIKNKELVGVKRTINKIKKERK